MEQVRERYTFASDNCAGVCPEALAAFEKANGASATASYGEDRWTALVRERVREIFEADCEVFLVFNGTAANALALAQLCRSFDAIVCHERAHIQTDECGAPEFFSSGAKLVTLPGAQGKIDIDQFQRFVRQGRDVHSQRPRIVSVTQATELGTVYTIEQVREIAEVAHARGMHVHMDGARFANAVVSLGCTPRQISRDAGVDVLCFGGTKNGLAAGELVIFFDRSLAKDFDYRVKQSGQLVSKSRLMAAPWLGLLADDVWLKNARHANAMASELADALGAAGVEIVLAVQANAVFARMPNELALALRARGWRFLTFIEPDICRLMCSWATTADELAQFAQDVREVSNSVRAA